MTIPIGQNLPIYEPELEDMLNVSERKLMMDLNCVKIGTIQSYNASNRTASIQIVFQSQLKNGTFVNVPLLVDCPVATLQGGGFSVQLPIQKGDTCIVLFADRNIDAWFSGGQVQPPPDGSLHAIGDAIAIVGVNWSNDSSIAAMSTSEARLTDKSGNTKFGITNGKLTVQNSTQNLLTILQLLITGILGMKTSNGGTLVDTTGDVTLANQDLSELLY
jgi:hypothetical protein